MLSVIWSVHMRFFLRGYIESLMYKTKHWSNYRNQICANGLKMCHPERVLLARLNFPHMRFLKFYEYILVIVVVPINFLWGKVMIIWRNVQASASPQLIFIIAWSTKIPLFSKALNQPMESTTTALFFRAIVFRVYFLFVKPTISIFSLLWHNCN